MTAKPPPYTSEDIISLAMLIATWLGFEWVQLAGAGLRMCNTPRMLSQDSLLGLAHVILHDHFGTPPESV